MMLASFTAGVLGISVYVPAMLHSGLLSHPIFHDILYLILIIVHSGIQLGRKVYLLDLATAETRATYIAISNTVIGIAMLIGGLLGLIAEFLAIPYVILLSGLTGLAVTINVRTLPEVSH